MAAAYRLSEPFFSVVLPTRDRPELAQRVVAHTLRQGFGDYELVVIDNGSDDRLGNLRDHFSDARIRMVRTGGLSMHDNWQRGFDEAHGRYVMMIEDKMFLVANALEACQRLLSSGDVVLLTWTNATCRGEDCETLRKVDAITTEKIPSSEFLAYGAHSMIDYYQKKAPRALNMVMEREFALSVQSKVGRLFRPMAPDYSSGALLLAFCSEFTHCHQTLSRPLRGGPSTGAAVGRRTPEAETFLDSLGMTREELFSTVPLRIPFFSNLIVADLMRFWRAAGLDETELPLDVRGYYLMMLGELLLAQEHGTPWRSECRQIRESFFALPLSRRVAFFPYALARFVSGWPNRKMRMRENLPKFLRALRLLLRGD